MCGIVGIIASIKKAVTSDLICKMRDVVRYRGPDDKGYWIDDDERIGLGHRRLSIIDTSSDGQQPMYDKENKNVIVYNGEVYNYLEIKDHLKNKGYIFKTRTDTEVILNAFKEWGTECLRYFNGMFSFAIWDKNKQELFVARDRLGIKPLYYIYVENTLYFASEIKSLKAVLPFKPTIRTELIDSYMSFGYVPGENTMLSGVKRLLPGRYMVLSKNDLKIRKYWDLKYENNSDKGEDYYIGKTKELINSSINLRLRSDVPLGIFLSGGIDSSAVVGLLAPKVDQPLKTFSVAYDFGPEYNETPYSAIVAERFNTNHTEIFVTPEQFAEFIPEYTWLMDEPVTESAAISLYFLSKHARNEVTVVLSGEGSDEIFGGYDLYNYMIILEKWRMLLGAKFSEVIGKKAGKYLPTSNKLRKYLLLSTKPLDRRYKGISTYDEEYKKNLYSQEYMNECKQNLVVDDFTNELFESTIGNDCLSRCLYFDTKTWLVDDLLIKADRMSMANSLELRVPFLDYRLVEFAASIPSKYKIKWGKNKYILKKIMGGVLPNEIINRKKMGFPTPLKIMFEKKLAGYAEELLLSSSSKIRTYFRYDAIERIIKEHTSKSKDHHRVIWQLVVLENWIRQNN